MTKQIVTPNRARELDSDIEPILPRTEYGVNYLFAR
jgi:hypothetical protein